MSLFSLPLLHALPVDEAVGVVEEEHREAEDHREIRRVFEGSEDPQNDQHNVVRRVREGVERTPAERKIRRQKACRDGQRTGQEIGGMEEFENKVKSPCDNGGQQEEQQHLRQFQPVHADFRLALFVRIPQPRNHRQSCHRGAHAEVGDHFAVIAERPRNAPVEYAENDRQNLPERISLCDENERGHADERSDQ